MKINKFNPLHWLYLALSGTWIVLGLMARALRARHDRSVVVLYGHKLQGNLLALKRELDSRSSDIEGYFLTLDPIYYYNQRNSGWLLALNPFHIFKVAFSDCIVTDHGLHALAPFLRFTSIQFVDVWHGVPFKGFVSDDFRIQHQYDEVWVSSPAMKTIYREEFGFSEQQLHVTGYGRIDSLLEYAKEPSQQIQRLGLDPKKCKRVLFAPTWRQELRADAEGGRIASLQEMLSSLDQCAKEKDLEIIFRPHINFSWKDIDIGSNTTVLDSAQYSDTEAILAVADCLITDWSSIAFDFMALGRPLIFIDCDPPFRYGLTLSGRLRAGRVVKTAMDLQEAVSEALENPAQYNSEYGSAYREAREIAWDETLDGKSTSRYAERLEHLLELK